MTRRRTADNEAVSPIIGTILVVAITVALAALVATMLGGYGKHQETIHQRAGVSISSPRPNILVAGLVLSEDQSGFNLTQIIISVDYKPCSIATSGAMATLIDGNGNNLWDVGESITLQNDCDYPAPQPLGSGSTHIVSISVKGTPVALDSEVRIK